MRNSTSRGFRLFVVLLLALGLIAAACGSDDGDDESGADDEPTEDATSEETATEEPAEPEDEATEEATDAPDETEPEEEPTEDTTAFVEIEGVPGVTDEEIRFSMVGTGTSSNPTGGCYLECFEEGVRAYFAYRNSEGGLFGRELVLDEPLDDELGQNQVRSLEIISADDTFATFDIPIVGSGYADFEAAGVPVYTYLTAVENAQMENLFGSPWGTNCPQCVRTDQAFIMDELGVTRVAALGYGVGSSADCANGVPRTVDFYSADVGNPEVVYLNPGLEFGLPNGVAPEVTAMREAGVELIFTCMDPNGVKAVAEEAIRQELDALIVQNSSFDAQFIAENPDVYDSILLITNPRPADANPEGTGRELFEQWMAETGAEVGAEIQIHGWLLADLAVKGIEAAGAPFDRQSVIEATNAIEAFTSDGFIPERNIGNQHLVPDPDDPATLQAQPYCWIIYQFDGGVPSLLAATAEEPWVCWERPAVDYVPPTLTNFS